MLSQAWFYGFTIEQGKQLLAEIKSDDCLGLGVLTDGRGANEFPRRVKGPKQIADGHLSELAKSHGAKLATFDGKIPGTMVIPN
jgi:hypothetical protein